MLFAFNVECAYLKVTYAVKSIFAFLCLLKEKKKSSRKFKLTTGRLTISSIGLKENDF